MESGGAVACGEPVELGVAVVWDEGSEWWWVSASVFELPLASQLR